jgi:cardiolipin synthase
MVLAKQLADLLTASRIVLALMFVWLARGSAAELLPLASILLLTSWVSDLLDGALARRSGGMTSWVGDHDLEVDVLVSLGVLAYLVGADYLEPAFAATYLLLWALIFWRWGWNRDPAMLFQAPIYLWFIIIAMQAAPDAGRWLIGYIVVVVVVTWPRFPREVVPGFLAGMSKLMRGD